MQVRSQFEIPGGCNFCEDSIQPSTAVAGICVYE